MLIVGIAIRVIESGDGGQMPFQFSHLLFGKAVGERFSSPFKPRIKGLIF